MHINNQEISILLFLLELRSFLTSIICSLRRILVDLILYPRRQRQDLVKIFVAGYYLTCLRQTCFDCVSGPTYEPIILVL